MLHPVVSKSIQTPLAKPFDMIKWMGGRNTPDGAILHFDATKNKHLLPVTYNGKYLVVKNV